CANLIRIVMFTSLAARRPRKCRFPKRGRPRSVVQQGVNMSEEIKMEIGKDLLTLRQVTRHVAERVMPDGDWGGLPIPVPGLKLVLEPRYKHKALGEFRWPECYDEDGIRLPLE